MANNVKINVDVVTNITGQDDVKKLQDSLNALSASNNSRVKSEKAYESAVKQRSVVQIAEENKRKQIQMDAHAASIAAYLKEASSLSNITRLSQHKASIELEAAKQKKSINDAAAKQEKSLASETQKAQKYAYKFTAIEVKMGIEGAKARAKAEKEAAAARAKAEKEAAREAERADKAEIKANNEKLKQEQQLKKVAEQRLGSAVSSASALVQKTQSSFSRIKDIALGTLAALGLDELFSSIGEKLSTATTNASSIVESENLLRATYNEGADALLNWADSNAEAYGLANASAKQYLSFLTGVLNNTDISSDKLGRMAQNYTRLVGDMASAYNTEIDDAFQAIRSGIAGNTLAMQRYGIVLSVTNLQQYLQSKGIDATYRSLDAASKQYVRYAYIMEHTAEVQGDYTRTFESFANSVKTLKNEWNNFLSLLGQYAIPVLMPIINALRTAIAYAGAILKYLAEIYGWEQYTTIAVDYSYRQVENIEDAVDSQEDLTKEVKNTNKALKSGVKLLDLYSLDFSDASSASSAGTTPEKSPVSSQLEDLANIDYKVPEIVLPKIDIDPGKVKEIGDKVAGTLNMLKGTWDNIIQPYIATPVENWLKDDVPGKIASAINLAIPLIAFKAIDVKKLAAWFKNLPTAVQTALKGAGGVALSAVGSWGLGTAIANSVSEGVPDLIGLITSFGSLAGGIGLITSAFGLLAGAATGIWGFFFTLAAATTQADQNLENLVGTILSGTETMEGFLSKTEEFVAIDKLSEAASNASGSLSDLDTSVNDVNTQLASVSTDLTQTELNELKTSCTNLQTEMKEVHDQSAIQLSTLFADSISAAGTAADNTVKSLQDYSKAQYDLAFTDQDVATSLYEGLKLRQLAGEELSDEDAARLSTLETLVNKTESVDSKLNELDFSNLNLTSLTQAQEYIDKEVSKFHDTMDTQRQLQEEIISQAQAYKDSDLGLHTDEYYDAQIEAAQAQIELLDANEDLFKLKLSQKMNEYWDGAFVELEDNRMPKLAKAYIDDLYTQIGNIFSTSSGSGLDDDLAKKIAEAVVGPDSSVSQYLVDNLGYSLEEATNMIRDGSAYTEIIKYSFAAATITGEFKLKGKILDENGNDLTDDMQQAMEAMIPELVGKLPAASRARRIKIMADAAKESGFGYESYEKDGQTFYRFVNDIDFTTIIRTNDNAEDIYGQVLETYETASEKFSSVASTEVVPDFVKPVVENFNEEVDSPDNTDKMSAAVEEGLTSALEKVETPEEAKTKGNDLAEAITSGVTKGFNTALTSGSEFMKAADNLTNTLVNIPTKFESAFKSAVNNVAGYINSLVNGLKQQLEGLNLPEGDLTVAQLYNSLKDSNFKIPMLANGGVIPANNPFLAVLGDQKSGVNVEAPVTVIQEAVRNVVNDPGTSDNIEVKVYIGDREIRDFVIDTVTANNLVVG